jgi:hypothetical protein
MVQQGRWSWWWRVAVAGVAIAAQPSHADPLVVLEHHLVGARLRVAPGELFVPKDIPGKWSTVLSCGKMR